MDDVTPTGTEATELGGSFARWALIAIWLLSLAWGIATGVFAELEPLPLAARVERMREPAMRRRLLCEIPADATNPLFLLLRDFERMFPMATTPTYEPAPDASVAGLAAKSGLAPLEVVYDLLLEDLGDLPSR